MDIDIFFLSPYSKANALFLFSNLSLGKSKQKARKLVMHINFFIES